MDLGGQREEGHSVGMEDPAWDLPQLLVWELLLLLLSRFSRV